MDNPHMRETHGPEWKIQKELIKFLWIRGWLVEVMHGNLFQKGVPDLFIAHPKHGQRWIDVKNPVSYNFTRDQRIKWPNWEKYKVGIWILVAATEEEYDKLWQPPNMRDYWKASWDLEPTVSDLLDELDDPFLEEK